MDFLKEKDITIKKSEALIRGGTLLTSFGFLLMLFKDLSKGGMNFVTLIVFGVALILLITGGIIKKKK